MDTFTYADIPQLGVMVAGIQSELRGTAPLIDPDVERHGRRGLLCVRAAFLVLTFFLFLLLSSP